MWGSAQFKCTDVSAVADSSRLGFFSIVIGDKAPTFRMVVVPSCRKITQYEASQWTSSEAAAARVKTDGKVASALIAFEPILR